MNDEEDGEWEETAVETSLAETTNHVFGLTEWVSKKSIEALGENLVELNELCTDWTGWVGCLQQNTAAPGKCPICHASCNISEELECALYNALVGYYRAGSAVHYGTCPSMQ